MIRIAIAHGCLGFFPDVDPLLKLVWQFPGMGILDDALPLVVHGHERTTWPVLRWAIAHGHGIRIGLEDTLELEGGRLARDNAELVTAAVKIAAS